MGVENLYTFSIRGSRGAPFGEGTLSPLRRYLKPLPKGDGGGGGSERGTEAPLRYLKGASKASKVSSDSAATLLAGCFFLRLRWQWIVLSRLGVALLSFVFF